LKYNILIKYKNIRDTIIVQTFYRTVKEGDGLMQKNVGDTDAYLRIALGLYIIGSGILKASRTMIFFGSLKVAEGITRFCPLLYLLNLSTNNSESKLMKAEKDTTVQADN
jgi:hypothetical protein